MRSTLSPPPLRVLIAEAHPIVVLGLADLLKTLGYMLVGSVASGPEAILAAGEHQPDLMLVDVDLGPHTEPRVRLSHNPPLRN